MGRNLVICCDGTANQYGEHNTNVVKLYEMIVLDENQLNFYDPGVGTSSRAVLVPFRWLGNKISQGLGLDLHRNVEDAYAYLMHCYEEGDKIFLFGFSRGAHTVRRLADVLGKYGLLYKGSDNMIPYVLRMYDADENVDIVKAFTQTYTRPCPIYFLGVWDTVSALSRLIPRSQLDGILTSEIANAYHAVSIDEKRFQFPPNLFAEKNRSPERAVEEVWFAGVHSDVGGSYDERGLSNIALKWLLQKAMDKGLKVIPDSIEKITTNALAVQHESWRGFFWFVPWHVYALLILLLILIVQFLTAYLGLFFDLPYRPFSWTLIGICEYWPFVITAILIGIPFTQKIRKIPIGARIHKSVEERWAHGKYRPKNLVKLVEEKKITWVD